ncbi:MAG: hypothetical protein JWR88_551, partial [Pseudonocardia sp.]|nr:hypothetical protein [Pseudonocardia sp.]
LVADWIERHCVIPDGFHAGKPYRLTDEQTWFLVNHYRVRPGASLGQLSPAFFYRRSQLVRPQKWGKGPLTAAQVAAEGVGPVVFAGWAAGGELYRCSDHGCGCGWVFPYEPGDPMGMPWPTPLIQLTAYSAEQTGNIYDAFRPMVTRGPLADLIPKVGEEFTRLPGGGQIDTVTSSAQSRLGQRVTFCAQDETGVWTASNGMVKVAETQRRGLAGMGGRSVETTNAWDPAEHSVAQRTAESRVGDVYRDHRLAPARLSYGNKTERRRIHKFVYGDSWWVDLDSIEAEAAELVETDPGQAERFLGNRVVAGADGYMPDELWEKGLDEEQKVEDGLAVCLAFDGSESDDWTAIRAETSDGWQFTPTYGPDSRPTFWDPKEWGGQIPRDQVAAAVDEMFERFRVKSMYCDPKDWRSEIADWSRLYGEAVAEWATYKIMPMHEALKRFLTDLRTGRVSHDGCPTTAVHMRNARKLAKPGQRYILGKPAQHQKIDLAVTSVLVHEAASDALADGWGSEPPPKEFAQWFG